MPVGSWPLEAYNTELKEKVEKSKVLVVGAGGIGCELLKTLALTGFRNIDAIDLDTIEISNLNRQFLFRKHHVGKSKALVAAEAVLSMCPDISIRPFHANIKESQFDLEYFRKFDIVMNGLDNLEARRHVNRMCLAAKVPLIESGTAGYLGQVSVHVGGKTECFDCQPKPTPKTYAVCTIRTSPEKFIHCVVWAKDLLFPALFGEADDENDLQTDGTLLKQEGEDAKQFAQRVFQNVYEDKIKELLKITEEDVWKGRPPPVPLDLNLLLADQGTTSDGDVTTSAGQHHLDTAVWTLAESANHFIESISKLLSRKESNENMPILFDKDDELAVEFVTSAANLRAMCYHIPSMSLFKVKGMAGNIIHAIATTNAIIPGFIVIEALKLLATAGDPVHCKTTFLRQDISNRKIIVPTALEPPNHNCLICGKPSLELKIDTKKTTLRDLLTKVARKYLGMVEPCLSYGEESMFMYEEGEGLDAEEVQEYENYLPMVISELPAGGIKNGTMVRITDQRQHLDFEIMVGHEAEWDEENFPDQFQIIGELPETAKENDNRDLHVGEDISGKDGKRKLDDEMSEVDGNSRDKRQKVTFLLEDSGVEIIDDCDGNGNGAAADDDSGAIEIIDD